MTTSVWFEAAQAAWCSTRVHGLAIGAGSITAEWVSTARLKAAWSAGASACEGIPVLVSLTDVGTVSSNQVFFPVAQGCDPHSVANAATRKRPRPFSSADRA